MRDSVKFEIEVQLLLTKIILHNKKRQFAKPLKKVARSEALMIIFLSLRVQIVFQMLLNKTLLLFKKTIRELKLNKPKLLNVRLKKIKKLKLLIGVKLNLLLIRKRLLVIKFLKLFLLIKTANKVLQPLMISLIIYIKQMIKDIAVMKEN